MAARGVSQVEVVAVARRRERRQFLALPERLYADDPHWVAPLRWEQHRRLFGANPLFHHAECQAFLALRAGRTVGRITAQLDRLYEAVHGRKVGFFGMFEAEDDPAVAAALFAAAEGWLAARGAVEVQGPFNLSINEEVGLLVAGFDSPPFVLMGHGRPWYPRLVEAAGYRPAKDLLTYVVRPDFEAPPAMRRLLARQGRALRVRPLDRRRRAAEFELLRELFNDAWAENWGFVPFTREEFAEVAALFGALLDDHNVQIAELDGVPAAFIAVLPNVNEAARDLRGRLLPWGWAKLLWRLKVRRPRSYRVPLMGVRRAHHDSPLGAALAFAVIDAVRQPLVRLGVERVELGWILEDNRGMRDIIAAIGGVEYKRYRIYRKPLPPRAADA
ncbi:MAG: hypothetical protein KatS3mg124_0370 [Porticoccaceae bacterium]|nr:MAG: hypothetical protein KatS3mg124_0370 [Porticoccaceae bacterium]